MPSDLLQIGLVTTLITTVVTMSSIAQLWDDEWEMVFISLQVSLSARTLPWGKERGQCS